MRVDRTTEQLGSSRTETLPNKEKLENEETLENKSHLPEYKHRDQPEGEAVEGRDQAAEPPDELPAAHPGHRDRATGDDESSRPPAPASQAPCSARAGTPR